MTPPTPEMSDADAAYRFLEILTAMACRWIGNDFTPLPGCPEDIRIKAENVRKYLAEDPAATSPEATT